MSKQIQDAYIVAATRTPIGKAPRGYFKNTRSDDLLVLAIQSALKQVPTLDPKAIEDAIVGCSFPEGEQGMNMARIAVTLAVSQLLSRFLFGLDATDPATIGAAVLVLGLSATAAAFLPARRASKTDPLIALRAE